MDAPFAQANEGQCFQHGRVYLFSDYDIDWRSAEESIHLNIPVFPQQECRSSRCQSRDICHLRSGNESASAIGGKTEERKQPLEYYIFEISSDRRHVVQACVLIPGVRHPVGSDTYGKRSTDDSSEEPAADAGHSGGGAYFVEQLQDGGWLLTGCGQRAPKFLEPVDGLWRNSDSSVRKVVEIALGKTRCLGKNFAIGVGKGCFRTSF